MGTGAALLLALALALLAGAAVWLSRDRAARAQALLTRELLTQTLRDGGFTVPGVTGHPVKDWRISAVKVPHVERCGDGKASTTDRVTVHVDLCPANQMLSTPSGPVQATCTLQCVVKVNLLPRLQRIGSINALVRLAGWSARLLRRLGLDWVVFLCLNRYNYYLPHAPDCMYENEAMFYRHIRPELPAAVSTHDQYHC